MAEQVTRVAIDFGILLGELAILIVLVAALLAITVRKIGVTRLQSWMGGGRIRSALKGSLLGFLIPFCTYSAIPMVVGMIQSRMRTATVAGFLLAAPVLDPIVIAVLAVLFGWQATVAYAVITFATVLVMSILADAWGVQRHFRPAFVSMNAGPGTPSNGSDSCSQPDTDNACSDEDPFTDPAPWKGWKHESLAAITYAGNLIRGLAIPMIIAVAVAAIMVGFVPDEFIARVAGPDNHFAVPLASLLGAPFYVSTEAFLPIASALFDSGMSIGAVFALVISASGVNIPELGLLSRMMTLRLLAVYVTAVLGIAVTAGFLIPLLL